MHREIVNICQIADGTNRDFTSLASKALWLRYPESVPIFDKQAQSALWVIAKFEKNLTYPSKFDSRYGPFLHFWLQLYSRYSDVLEGIDLRDYKYCIRIFDRILWLIGEPIYERSKQNETESAPT